MSAQKSVRRMHSGISLTPSRSSSFGDFNDTVSPSTRDIVMMESGGGLTNGTSTPGGTSLRNAPSTTSKQRRESKGGGSHKDKDKKFNPRMIFSQIVALQCFHYVILGVLFQINYMFFGRSITIDRIFTDEYIKMWSAKGLPDTFAVLVSSVAGAVLLAIIVEKSKKCLDFAFTLFLIHLAFCTAYNGLPATWDWWVVNVLGTIIMILLGEYVCSLKELNDIPLLQL